MRFVFGVQKGHKQVMGEEKDVFAVAHNDQFQFNKFLYILHL